MCLFNWIPNHFQRNDYFTSLAREQSLYIEMACAQNVSPKTSEVLSQWACTQMQSAGSTPLRCQEFAPPLGPSPAEKHRWRGEKCVHRSSSMAESHPLHPVQPGWGGPGWGKTAHPLRRLTTQWSASARPVCTVACATARGPPRHSTSPDPVCSGLGGTR